MFQSGKAACFLSPNTFIVKDPEQEKKFSFCLQDSLRIANSQPLLQVLTHGFYFSQSERTTACQNGISASGG